MSKANRSNGFEERQLCRALVGKGVNSSSQLRWERLRYIAHRHGLLYQLNESIKQYAYEIPPSFQHEMREHILVKIHRSSRIIKEMLRLNEHFKTLDIPVLFYKGPVLSQYLYGNASARPSVDLDILVHTGQVGDILDSFYQIGYKSLLGRPVDPFLRFDCEFSIESPSGVQIELHWNILPPRWGSRVPFHDWYAKHIAVEICGQSLPTLSPESLVFALCAHAAKHRWEKWKLIYDLHCLCKRDINWSAVVTLCREQGFLRVFRVAMLLTQHSFGLDLPPEIQSLVDGDKIALELAQQVLADLQSSLPPPQGLERRLFDIRLRERFTDQFRYFVQAIIGPGVRDILFCPLPRSWDHLYYLIRPVRWIVRGWFPRRCRSGSQDRLASRDRLAEE